MGFLMALQTLVSDEWLDKLGSLTHPRRHPERSFTTRVSGPGLYCTLARNSAHTSWGQISTADRCVGRVSRVIAVLRRLVLILQRRAREYRRGWTERRCSMGRWTSCSAD